MPTRQQIRNHLWIKGDLSWKLHSTQQEIHERVSKLKAQEILLLCTRQLGKSYWAVNYAIEFCIKNPGKIVRILAPTLKQVQDIVNDNLVPICLDAPHGMITPMKTAYRWQIWKSQLRLGPLEREHVDYNRGGNAALVITEEGGFVKSDDYKYAVESVIGPQLLRTGGSLIHVTTPSEDPIHYLHTEVKPKTELSDAFFHYDIYDNPQLTEEQIEKAATLCGGKHTATWKREYLAQIVRDPASIVVPTFNKEFHVKQWEIPGQAKTWISIDFGGTRDKTVSLVYAYDFSKNKIIVLSERYFEANTPTETIVGQIREQAAAQKNPVSQIFADCPGQLMVDLRTKHDFQVILPRKDDWLSGINNMQLAFAKDEVIITPECKFLIQSLEAGMFNKTRTDFERSQVLGHCDALAALNYALRMVDKTISNEYIQSNSNYYVNLKKHQSQSEKISEIVAPNYFIKNDFKGVAGKKFGQFKN